MTIFALKGSLEEITPAQLSEQTCSAVFITDSAHAEETLRTANITYEGVISLRDVVFCKIESQPFCLAGTLSIPKLLDVKGSRHRIQFFIDNKNMVIIDDEEFSLRLVQRIQRSRHNQGESREHFIYNFFSEFMLRDTELLAEHEQKLMELEENVNDGKTDDFLETITPIRKELLILRSYYDEIMDLGRELEYFNPAGSVKDRVALAMIEEAEKKGVLKKGATIIEPTSGNTGIGLAAVGVSKGYKVILTMPETMSIERRNLLKAYGAQIVLTEGAKGMTGAIKKADELKGEIENSVILGQFVNPANPAAHFATTGPEIWEDTDGKVDIFIAGVGTGGTVTGVGQYLKSKNPDVKIVAVEPATSPVLSQGKSGPHKIQGIGAGFVPEVLDTKVYDEILPIENEDAFKTGNKFAKTEGILVGISSGAALKAAEILSKRPENKGKTIVALLPDTGERYLSTALFES